jgi:hypothetical protein
MEQALVREHGQGLEQEGVVQGGGLPASFPGRLRCGSAGRRRRALPPSPPR